MNAQQAGQELLYLRHNLFSSGRAASICGAVVSPGTYLYLEERVSRDTALPFNGVLTLMGDEGNRWLKYQIWVMAHNIIGSDPRLSPYLLTPHSRAYYEEHLLGHELEILQQPPRTMNLGERKVLIETDRLTGQVELRFPSGSTHFHGVRFEEMIAFVQAGGIPEMEISAALNNRYGIGYPVNNPPSAEWRGKVWFSNQASVPTNERVCYGFQSNGQFPYKLVGAPEIKHVGRLLMKEVLANNLWAMVAVVIDKTNTIREFIFPGSEHRDRMAFGQYALQYFLPEEVFDFIYNGSGTYGELEALRQVPIPEFWGSRMSEVDGQMRLGTIGNSPSRSIIFTSLSDTRANNHLFDIEIEEDAASWATLMARYFPTDHLAVA